MTHPIRIPRKSREIPAYTDSDAWLQLGHGDTHLIDRLFLDRDHVWPWLEANGFRFYVPDDSPIHLTPDGRTAYLERSLIRTPSPWNRPQTGPARLRDRYALTADRMDLRRRLVGFPITRSLHDYAPTLATRIGIR